MSRYNAAAVARVIAQDRRIGAKEAKRIHALLRGRERDPEILEQNSHAKPPTPKCTEG